MTLNYRTLGTSGLKVSPFIIGCMSYGTSKWRPWVLDEKEALPILKAAYDAGINTWDTANMYSNGYSEKVIAAALRTYNIPRNRVVIMTKAYFPVSDEPSTSNWLLQCENDPAYVNRMGLSRQALFAQVEDSLKRLETDYIDVLQIHRLDQTPFEEIMQALHDLVQSGRVRYIGASSMWAHEFAQLQFIAEKRGWTKFISMQNYHNLLYREEGREMNRFCRKTGVGLIPWSPLAEGALARPFSKMKEGARAAVNEDKMDKLQSSTDKETIDRVEEVAKKKGLSMAQVAFLWCTGEVTAPIVGISKVERLQEMLEALKHNLTEEEKQYLEEPYRPKPVFGFNQDR